MEAREHRFTQQIDELGGDLLCLKAQVERYCVNVHVDGGNSTTTAPGPISNHSGQQTNHGSESSPSQSSMQQASSTMSSGPTILSQTVIQHFNTLGIDLRKFYNQMEKGDKILQPFNKLSTEFQRNKSTKAARCKRLKLYSYMKEYQGGPEACISHFHKLTASQLYDRQVKQSR